jgi:uncharacterized protein YcnI
MNRHARIALVGASVTTLLMLAVPAWAHVTVRTDNPEAGAFAKYTVRVPNERDDSSTVGVEIELPEGLEAGGYQPVQGWDITIDGGVLSIEGGEIAPGQFQEFSFSARNPEQAGDLEFPAIQIYDDGEEVAWIGEADSDEPAPVVTIAAAGEGDGADAHGSSGDAQATESASPSEDAVASEAPTPSEQAEASEVAQASEPADIGDAQAAAAPAGSGTSSAISWVALALAVIAAILGGAAFARSGSRR